MRLLAGNPGNHPLNLHEPKPGRAFKLPPCPKHLVGEAKHAWKKLGHMLIRLGVLTENDLTAFELLCEAYGRWREMTAQLQREGPTMVGIRGAIVPHPLALLADKAFRDYRFMCGEFGLTPSSRSRVVAVGHTDDCDDLD